MEATKDAVEVASHSHMVFFHAVTIVIGIKDEPCWTSFDSFTRTHPLCVVLQRRRTAVDELNMRTIFEENDVVCVSPLIGQLNYI